MSHKQVPTKNGTTALQISLSLVDENNQEASSISIPGSLPFCKILLDITTTTLQDYILAAPHIIMAITMWQGMEQAYADDGCEGHLTAKKSVAL